MEICFECSEPATEQHHVVPSSRGGTQTVWLCGKCHGLVHNISRSDDTGRLTREAMHRKRSSGGRVSRFAPYGYEFADGRVVENVAEQAILVRVRVLRESGLTLRAISAVLLEDGYTNRKGKPFPANSIWKMLKDRERIDADEKKEEEINYQVG